MLKEHVVLLLKCTSEKAAGTKARGHTGKKDLGQMREGVEGKEMFWGTAVTRVRVGAAQGTAAWEHPWGTVATEQGESEQGTAERNH